MDCKLKNEGVKIKTVHNAIAWFVETGMLKTTKTTRWMFICVVNYEKYQELDGYKNQETKFKPSRDKIEDTEKEAEIELAREEIASEKCTKKDDLKTGRRREDDTISKEWKNEIMEVLSKDSRDMGLEIVPEKKEYGRPDLNALRRKLLMAIGMDDFKETVGMQRQFIHHINNLKLKIWDDEFLNRLHEILEDEFKAKNCNKVRYLYGELKSFIHSPVVETTDPKKNKIYDIHS
jgi:hypothetical protein